MSHQGVEVPAEGNSSEAVKIEDLKMEAFNTKPKHVALMTADFEKVVCCRSGLIARTTRVLDHHQHLVCSVQFIFPCPVLFPFLFQYFSF